MITRKLPCALSEEDLLDRGKLLANAEYSYKTLDNERKATAADFKTQLDAIDGAILELSTAIRDRIETRDVECTMEKDFALLRKNLIRKDTGEIVEWYEMTEEDRQQSLLDKL